MGQPVFIKRLNISFLKKKKTNRKQTRKGRRFFQNASIVIYAFEVLLAKPFKFACVQYCETDELLEQKLKKKNIAATVYSSRVKQLS